MIGWAYCAVKDEDDVRWIPEELGGASYRGKWKV
jgi:hypothetical protein